MNRNNFNIINNNLQQLRYIPLIYFRNNDHDNDTDSDEDENEERREEEEEGQNVISMTPFSC